VIINQLVDLVSDIAGKRIGKDRQTVRYIADFHESWSETLALGVLSVSAIPLTVTLVLLAR
jgi:hypothetical protein